MGSVSVSNGVGNPFQNDVNYRGFTASPLLGSAQGLSVYLDGLRLNQPFGDVVSWDLIPKAAIDSLALMPGSNPLFGLNTLGGALNVQTKTGFSHAGSSVQLQAGSFGRRTAEFEHGGHASDGTHWYLTGQRLHERGWRERQDRMSGGRRDRDDDGYIARRGFGNDRSGYDRDQDRSGRERDFGDSAGYGTGGSTRETMQVAAAAGGTVVGACAIVDRSGGRAAFDVPFTALLPVDLPTYPPDSCPLCAQGLPVVKPGSRQVTA